MRRRLFAALTLLCVVPTTAAGQTLVAPADDLEITSRTVHVALEDGLATVTTRIRVENRGDTTLEGHLRVPLPPRAGLAGLRACLAGRCRRGRPDTVGAYRTARVGRRRERAPIATASRSRRRTREPPSLGVSFAPVPPGQPFEIEVRYVAPTRTALGVTRLELPIPDREGDGDTPNVAIRVDAPRHASIRVNGATGSASVALHAGPDAPIAIEATMRIGAREIASQVFRCGANRCIRYRAAAGPAPPQPRDVFLLLDASASATHTDPSLRRRALHALLEALAPDSRVVRVAYAREARVLDEAPLGPVEVPRDVALPYLGNRTRIEAAWDAIAPAVGRATDPLVVVLGDGAITRGADARAALAAIRASGAELSVITLAQRRFDPTLGDTLQRSGGLVASAEQASLEDVRRLTFPLVDARPRLAGAERDPIRAGDERAFTEIVVEGGASSSLIAFGTTRRPTEPPPPISAGLAVATDASDPRSVLTAAAPEHFELARKRRAAPFGAGFGPALLSGRVGGPICTLGIGCGCRVYGSASREALGRMRARFRPRVTECFRRARAGRPRWSGRATVAVTIEYGELVGTRVESASDPALAACLADVADDLADIPFSDGVILARFPFRSEAVARPAAVPLAGDVDRLLGAMFGTAGPTRPEARSLQVESPEEASTVSGR